MDKRKTLNHIKKNVRKFTQYLLKYDSNVCKVILFGSYAKKKFEKYSDIDVCVVIKDSNKNLDKEMAQFVYLSGLVDSRIEAIPYSNKELQNPDDPLAYEIRKYGIEIKV